MNSGAINAEIHTIGPEVFEAVKTAVFEHATLRAGEQAGSAQHRASQLLLEDQVCQLLAETQYRVSWNAEEFWQVVWPRVTYAGTRAAKANAEIAAMRKHWLFADHSLYDELDCRFSKAAWEGFARDWKARHAKSGASGSWLDWAKSQADWRQRHEQLLKSVGAPIVGLMVKDKAMYPDLRFSAHSSKMEKYVSVAEFLNSTTASRYSNILDYYTGDVRFKSEHLIGPEYIAERKGLLTCRMQLKKQVGRLTALHTMMDMGLKTIKPDRVMTFLFSQLGWLQTLPKSLSQKDVIDLYLHPDVIDEMTLRADVLASALASAGKSQTHRLLDIWFVKYGQEADPEFGIQKNLQAEKDGGIARLYDRVKSTNQATGIDAAEADRRWAITDFTALAARKPRTKATAGATVKSRTARRRTAGCSSRVGVGRRTVMSRDDAEKLFVAMWRAGRAVDPKLYPPRMDNEPKESILAKIERGLDAHSAFLSVLRPDDDEVTPTAPDS